MTINNHCDWTLESNESQNFYYIFLSSGDQFGFITCREKTDNRELSILDRKRWKVIQKMKK